MVWFILGHSGQRTSVKCAEAEWNYKAGGIVHLKSPAVFASGPTGTDACIDLESRLITAVWMNDTR